MNKMRTMIITGGSIDDMFVMRYLMEEPFDYLIAADRGLAFLHRCHLHPDCIVGDYDSVDASVIDAYKEDASVEVHTFEPEKDNTDTDLAIRLAIEKGSTHICLLGATGTRLDHTIANIHCMYAALSAGIDCCIVDAHNRIRLTDRVLTLTKKGQFGDNVSLLPLGGDVTGVTLRGFYYPLEDAVLSAGASLGISNKITEETALVTCKDGVLVVIESRD
jgi:thiamine pyrophosphokinase